jgi:hypothetical protein
MTKNSILIIQIIVEKLKKNEVHHEVHNFKPGIAIIDIWHNNLFYVLHIDENKNSIGLSIIDDNSSFDNNPDEVFYDLELFMMKFNQIIKGV